MRLHLVRGIGLSPDKLLQGRLFAYGDAQRYRLGVNNDQIPVNQAHCPVHSYHRDGMMRGMAMPEERRDMLEQFLANGILSRSTTTRH